MPTFYLWAGVCCQKSLCFVHIARYHLVRRGCQIALGHRHRTRWKMLLLNSCSPCQFQNIDPSGWKVTAMGCAMLLCWSPLHRLTGRYDLPWHRSKWNTSLTSWEVTAGCGRPGLSGRFCCGAVSFIVSAISWAILMTSSFSPSDLKGDRLIAWRNANFLMKSLSSRLIKMFCLVSISHARDSEKLIQQLLFRKHITNLLVENAIPFLHAP